MPPITVFCPFTRAAYVRRWFDDLYSTDLDPANTNLAFIIDIGEDEEGQPIGQTIYTRIMDEMNKVKFRKFLIARNYEHHVNGINIGVRRKRIADIHNQSKELIRALDGEYVLGLEDDTVFTNLSVSRLFMPFSRHRRVGLVSSYEAGRWLNKIIGVWYFNDVIDPLKCRTASLEDKTEQEYNEVDATGMYCYLTPTELYLKHDYYSEDWQPWGPDVNYGLWLRKMGYKNFVDWTQPTGHLDGDRIIMPDGDIYVEEFTHDPKAQYWNRKAQKP